MRDGCRFCRQSIRCGLMLLCAAGAASCASDRQAGGLPQPGGALSDGASSEAGVDPDEMPVPVSVESEHGRFELSWRESFQIAAPGWLTGNWSWDDNSAWLSPDMVQITGGSLQLTLADAGGAAPSGKPYWGAEYYTRERYQYGRFVTRARLPVPAGVVASFFLLRINRDDAGTTTDLSELDIEFAGTSRAIQFTAHWLDGAGRQHSDPHTVDLGFDASEDFHEYAIEWTSGVIAYFVDGEQLFATTDSVVLSEINQPLSIHMNYWISPSVPWVGTLDPRVLPTTAEYDYVAYYRWLP